MRHKIIFVSAALLILSLMLVNPLSDLMSRNRSADTAALATKNSIAAALSQLPILFIQNQGQLDKAVEYYVKAPAQTLYFTKEGITFDVTRHNQVEATGIANRQAERLVFSLDFLGANNKPSIESTGKDNAVVNYFIGNDPEKWHSDIPTYREVVYHDIYPSIDLRLLGKGNVLEYDFVVRPGASPDDIALAYNGIDSLKIQNGQLAIGTAFGDIKQDRPYIYQQIGDETVKVAGGFSLGNGNTYGFDVPAYDERYPLVIDPTLAYSTYLGGSEPDRAYGIAVDSAGCAYVTGFTFSTDFPTQNAYQGTNAGSEDAFVAKLSAAGNSLIYSTYLGGSDYDDGYGIAVDSAGCAYVNGYTRSTDFPTQNAYQGTNAGNNDAFVTKLCSSTQPTVTTSAATGISTSSALNMSYTLGGYSSVDVRFAYKVSTASSWTYTLWVSKSAAGTYAETVTGLLPGIQYDFKAQLKYNSTVIEGDTLQFTTIMLPAQPRVSPSLPRQLNQAQLSLQYLNVSPQQASANQPVTISTNVVNTGDEAGSLNVALKINGQVEQTRMVSVGAQATQPVKFTVTRSQPGTYTVDILDQNGSFNVLGAGGTGGKPVNSGMVIFVALAVLALTVVVVLMMTFRRSA